MGAAPVTISVTFSSPMAVRMGMNTLLSQNSERVPARTQSVCSRNALVATHFLTQLSSRILPCTRS